MAKRFDASFKGLLEYRPEQFLPLLAPEATGFVEMIDSDLSTLTAMADKVLMVDHPDGRYIVHAEAQASSDSRIADRICMYNVLLGWRLQLPVKSVLVLLRPLAMSTAANGVLERTLPGQDRPNHRFEFSVLRLWEVPVERMLQFGPAVLPLSPLADVQPEQLPTVVERMEHRLSQEVASADAAELWTATHILMGLRYEREMTQILLRGVRQMKESVTYQAILEEGEIKGLTKGIAKGRQEGRQEGQSYGTLQEAKKLLLRLGKRRLGPAPTEIVTAIEAIEDVERLEALVERVIEVKAWTELFDQPS